MNKNANLGKSSGENAKNSNFAKKATLTAITAMAALTLAACGNNDVSAKPAGSSEPKTEQPAKTNANNKEDQELKQFVNRVRSAGFEIVPDSATNSAGSIGVSVNVDGYNGRIGDYGPDEYLVNFKESLGPDATGIAHNSKELSEILTQLKQMIAEKK